MELKNVVPWGRTFDEYREMFSLNEDDLKRKILGCGDGPASFNAELTSMGGTIVLIDPTYQFSKADLKGRISEVYDEVMPQMELNKDKYLWKSITSVEELGKCRMQAMDFFLDDYEDGKESGRYLNEALPSLPFSEQQFDLALCSHYLFLYSDHVDLEQHIQSMKELCRVSKEVRVYPLLTLNGEISPHLAPVMNALVESGSQVSLVPVQYQFQKGATEMLVVKSV